MLYFSISHTFKIEGKIIFSNARILSFTYIFQHVNVQSVFTISFALQTCLINMITKQQQKSTAKIARIQFFVCFSKQVGLIFIKLGLRYFQKLCFSLITQMSQTPSLSYSITHGTFQLFRPYHHCFWTDLDILYSFATQNFDKKSIFDSQRSKKLSLCGTVDLVLF